MNKRSNFHLCTKHSKPLIWHSNNGDECPACNGKIARNNCAVKELRERQGLISPADLIPENQSSPKGEKLAIKESPRVNPPIAGDEDKRQTK